MNRGVYEEEIAAAGQRWYKVVTSDGQVGVVHLPNSIREGLIKELWDRLDRLDPEIKLHLVTTGSKTTRGCGNDSDALGTLGRGRKGHLKGT